jgi:hypothetical protein
MKKLIISILILISLLISETSGVSAVSFVAKVSDQTPNEDRLSEDYRVLALYSYFKSHNSPLADYSQDFIKIADKYELDWRLIPAISGVESTFGKNLPSGSYNAYGWANGKYSFESWEESIEIVSKTIREKYINKGAVSVNQIGRIYAPPSSTWSWKVNYFMNEIDPLPVEFSL